jgi:hypothetical protein
VTAGVAAVVDPESKAAKELAGLLEVRAAPHLHPPAPPRWPRTNLRPQPPAGPPRRVPSLNRPSPLFPQVTPAQVAAEAARVPQSDLDIDTLYLNLLAANPEFAGPLAAAAGEGAGGAGDYADMFK